MSDPATVGAAGGAASGVSEHLEHLHPFFETFNEMVRTEGDVLTWVQEHFDPQAEYRPIEDRDWFCDPQGITSSLICWIETWGVGYRIKPEEIRSSATSASWSQPTTAASAGSAECRSSA